MDVISTVTPRHVTLLGMSQVFSSYGVTPYELSLIDNRYFATHPVGIYTSLSGKTFSNNEQLDILDTVQGTYFLMLVICQSIHIWVCSTATTSIYSHGIFKNKVTVAGVLAALTMACVIVYVPPLRPIFSSGTDDNVPVRVLVGSLACFVFLWSWSEMRKFFIRNYPKNKYVNRFLKL